MSETVLAVCVHMLTNLRWSHTPFLLFLPLIFSHVFTLPTKRVSNEGDLLFDYLSPYPPGRHGSRRTIRDISNCQHTTWRNRTFETFKVSTDAPISDKVSYHLHKFADVIERPLGRKYLVGNIAFIDQPYHTFSVLEPGGAGGCRGSYFATRSTVQDTVNSRKGGCMLAANAGYFVVSSGKCLGNVVSDGRIVQTADNQQNANFGIREDGTIVVGYIPDDEVKNATNPFRQLVTGVVWLVRNGTNYVNESKKLECATHEDTGRMDTFVDVVSARSALGHDAQGRLVMAQVEGQTHRRGANLVEFADLLIRHGVVNAVNLDGGGSSTLIENNVLINYPSDHCYLDGQYRCPRAVSTALCIHDVQCLDPECTHHGVCEATECSCETPWTGVMCESVNCSATNCSGHGNCTDGSCHCYDGWKGDLCNEACSSNRYGPGCKKFCWCYGNAHCHPTTGHCVCPPGFSGYSCVQACDDGHYGAGCHEKCVYPDCSGHGHCSKLNGTCLCNEGWTGVSCNISIIAKEDGSGDYLTPLYPFSTLPVNILPSPSLSSYHSITPQPVATQQQGSQGSLNSTCECSKPCNDGIHTAGDSTGKNYSNTTQSLFSMEDNTVQWAVAISLLIALLTLLIHALLCYLTRRWAYMSVNKSQGLVVPANVTSQKKRKKLKRRKPRPKFRAPLMLHYASSTDCSL